MKKIAITCESMKMGGTEIALLSLINKLLLNNHQIVLYLVSDEGPLMDSIPEEVDVRKIEFNNIFVKYLVGATYSKGIIGIIQKIICKIYRILLDFFKYDLYQFVLMKTKNVNDNFDVVLDAFGYGRFVTAFANVKLKSEKKATWFHDENIWWIGKTMCYFEGFNHFICVSNAVKYELDRSYPLGKNKSIVIHNLIDCERIKKLSEEQTDIVFDYEGVNILTIGRLHEQKGIDIVIEIADELDKKGIKFKWYVIGDGVDKFLLQKLIDEKGLNEKVVLLGMKKNPYPYLKMCDLYVQPSRYEGYGLTILEARVLNKPIVATSLSCFKEQIKNEKTGILVELNVNDFTEAIIEMISNEDLRNTIINNLQNEHEEFEADYGILESIIG